MPNNIRIGTRGSELALVQTDQVRSYLQEKFPDKVFEIRIIKTTGDDFRNSRSAGVADKGLFTKEIETALLDGLIDMAVHSYKDLPTDIPGGLEISAVPERASPQDVLILHPEKKYSGFAGLPKNAVIATGSLRRKSQLLNARPDLRIVEIRGNLQTRIDKLRNSGWDGMILAKAGVQRAGLEQYISETLPFGVMLPAAGQGALAIEIRKNDGPIESVVRISNHTPTATAVNAERALLHRLEGGCQVPVGVYAGVEGEGIRIQAMVGSMDGRRIVRGEKEGKAVNGENIGIGLAEELLEHGGREILSEIRKSK